MTVVNKLGMYRRI